jgi:hypothetical protein
MVGIDGPTSNQLLETLQDWEDQLQHLKPTQPNNVGDGSGGPKI